MISGVNPLLSDRAPVHSTCQRLATVVDGAYRLLCWHIWRRRPREDLQARRAAYGEQDSCDRVARVDGRVRRWIRLLSPDLDGRLAEWVTDEAIVVMLSPQPSAPHFCASLAVAGMAIPSEREAART